MKKNKIYYYFINLFFLAITIFFIIKNGLFKIEQFSNIKVLISLVLIFIVIHLFKFFRLYVIALEENMKTVDLFKKYIISLFVNICIPYKVGEVCRMYLIGNKNKHYVNGIIIVLMDKFFDAIVLSIMLVTISIINKAEIQSITILIILFLLLCFIVFVTFESTYNYLNTFFITKKENKKSIYALKMLEKINDIYLSSKKTIRGRFPLLFLLTLISWGLECLFVQLTAKFYNIEMNSLAILNYLNDAFFGGDNNILSIYISTGIISIVGILIIIYIKKIGDRILCKK